MGPLADGDANDSEELGSQSPIAIASFILFVLEAAVSDLLMVIVENSPVLDIHSNAPLRYLGIPPADNMGPRCTGHPAPDPQLCRCRRYESNAPYF